MSQERDDFVALLELARQGDQQAMERLTRQYEPKVRLVARVLLGPSLRPYLDSIDLVQSVHHTVLLGLRQQKFTFDSPDNLIALALTLLRRKVARKWRHLQRQKRIQGHSESVDYADLFASLACPQADPSRLAQLNDQLRQVFQQMSEVDRRIMELRIEGFTSAEIAEQMELSSANIRVRVTRLRQYLQESGLMDDWL